MRFSRHSTALLRAAVLLAACGCAAAPSAFAADPADAQRSADAQGGQRSQDGAAAGGDRGPDDGGRHGFGASGPGVPGPDAPPRRDGPPHHGGAGSVFGQLHRLDLSEAQQDKLFAITHAAAPKEREQEKAEHKAHDALRALGASADFNEARAAAAARELGQAIANGVLLRARLESQVLAVLTPEQREQLRKDRPPGPPHKR